MDGVDAALVSIADNQCTFLDSATTHYTNQIHNDLLALNDEPTIALSDFINLDLQVAGTFADVTHALLRKSKHNAADIAAIGSHGQTIYHQPTADFAGTLQIGDPNTIAHLTAIDVVADFRRADMARSGQGAPLVPAFHHHAMGNTDKPRVILNLGGIANISVLDSGVSGFDTGPANTLLDAWCQHSLNTPFDQNGEWSRSGTVQQELLSTMLLDPYFNKAAPKSTGKDTFNLSWLNQQCDTKNYRAEDIQATLLELSAATIATAIHNAAAKTTAVYACGGGTKNAFLMQRLEHLLAPKQIGLTTELGVDADACEAIAFAWLAYRHKSGLSGNVPAVTGATDYAILGGLYPGRSTGPVSWQTNKNLY